MYLLHHTYSFNTNTYSITKEVYSNYFVDDFYNLVNRNSINISIEKVLAEELNIDGLSNLLFNKYSFPNKLKGFGLVEVSKENILNVIDILNKLKVEDNYDDILLCINLVNMCLYK